jgi:hypothetical protein
VSAVEIGPAAVGKRDLPFLEELEELGVLADLGNGSPGAKKDSGSESTGSDYGPAIEVAIRGMRTGHRRPPSRFALEVLAGWFAPSRQRAL